MDRVSVCIEQVIKYELISFIQGFGVQASLLLTKFITLNELIRERIGYSEHLL